jgi:hypothetical protein
MELRPANPPFKALPERGPDTVLMPVNRLAVLYNLDKYIFRVRNLKRKDCQAYGKRLSRQDSH